MSFNYLDPILGRRRKGTDDDPFTPISQPIQVPEKCVLQLAEIPDRLSRVLIPDMVEVQEIPDNGLESNMFYVDYFEGFVHVHSSLIDSTLLVSYKGTGGRYFPASRIWVSVDSEGNITQVLSDLLEGASNFVDKGTYNPETTYQTYNIVRYLGSSYMCQKISIGNAPTDSTYWTRISGYSFKGTYSNISTYQNGDVVVNAENTTIYQSKTDNNIGNALTDTSKWQTLIDVQLIIDEINQAEQERDSAENIRQSAEDERILAEENRASAEDARETKEDVREANEQTRQLQESDRQANTATAISNAETATQNAQNLVDTSVHLGAWNISTNYATNNQVRHNGSTWRALRNSTGVTPVEGINWTLVAQRGLDGAGSVSSVNNVFPDLSGNVQLTPEDIGLAELDWSNITNKPTSVVSDIDDAVAKKHNHSNKTILDKIAQSGTESSIDLSDISKHENRISNIENELVDNLSPTPVTLTLGTNVYNITNYSKFDNLTMRGKILVNLLGNNGNCEDVSKLTNFQCTLSLDTTKKVTGINAIKVTIDSGASFGRSAAILPTPLNISKYYIIAAYVDRGTSTNIKLYTSGTGGTFGDYTYTTPTFAYAKVSGASVSSITGVGVQVSGSAGQYGFVDAIMCYEILQAEYDALDSMTVEQVAAKYPYVDNMQSITNPYVIAEGENLVPPIANSKWTDFNPSSIPLSVNSDYSFIIDNSSGSSTVTRNVDIDVNENVTYSFSVNLSVSGHVDNGGVGGYYNLSLLDKGGNIIENANTPPYAKGNGEFTFSKSFLTPTGTTKVSIVLGVNSDKGTYAFSNPMLNVGAELKPFKPQNRTYKLFHSAQDESIFKLRSNVDGSVYDEYKDGKIVRKFKELPLNGSLGWNYYGTQTGYKLVRFPISGVGVNSGVVIKYDGKVAPIDANLTASDSWRFQGSPINEFAMYVSNTDSGWGDSFTPSVAEIQAYFNGYKMNNGTFGTAYNGTGTKTWTKRYATNNTGAVTVVPIQPTDDILNGVDSYYRLQYQIASPIVIDAFSEGEVELHEGVNQITMGSGVIVREQVTPFNNGTNNYINDRTSNQLKNRAKDMLAVYRSGNKDDTWKINQHSGSSNIGTYGNVYYVQIDSPIISDAMSVTYFALDAYKFNISPQTIDATYQGNLGSVVRNVTKEVIDHGRRLDVIQQQYAKKQQPSWIVPTLLNGWVDYDSNAFSSTTYYKDEFGIVHLSGLVKSGVVGDPIFYLPIGYRPKKEILINASCYSGTTQVTCVIGIKTTGQVYQAGDIKYNFWQTLDGISFRAEQ